MKKFEFTFWTEPGTMDGGVYVKRIVSAKSRSDAFEHAEKKFSKWVIAGEVELKEDEDPYWA